jgi:hypothetical protein
VRQAARNLSTEIVDSFLNVWHLLRQAFAANACRK